MENKKLPVPPSVTDFTDNDKQSEYHQIRLGLPTYPQQSDNEAIVKLEMEYSLKLEKTRTLKAIGMGIIAAVAGLLYTFILLIG